MNLITILVAGAAVLAAAAPHAASAQTVVPVAKFDSIELSTGGQVTVRHGPVQRVTLVRGSTDYTEIRVDREGSLVIQTCNDRCPRRYDMEIEVVTPRIEAVAVSAGGSIKVLPGFPRQRTVAASVHAGGQVDLRGLAVADAAASVNGGGSLMVRADRTLAASVNGGGDIRYWGDPKVTAAINGGGLVREGR